LLVVLLAVVVGSGAFGATRRPRCRVICRPAIDACVTRAAERELGSDLGPRARRRAIKQLRNRCRSGLVAACRTSPDACAPVTTSTVPATTTTTTTATTTSPTTTLPTPRTLTGGWHFEGEGTESCSSFATQVAVSFRMRQSGTALDGTWFPDASASGRGAVTGPSTFRFVLDGTARHLTCVITGLVMDARDLTHGTLSATAECPEGPCSGQWSGMLTRVAP
jgi:hypothetical protein